MPATDTHPFIARILEVAAARGETQDSLARRSGIAPETLSRMKSADSPRLCTLVKLAGAVGYELVLRPAAMPTKDKESAG